MPSVTIDAGVLAAPASDSTVDTVHRYIDTLLDWRQLLKEQWVAIYMSARASETLFYDGMYPLRDSLKDLFRTHGVMHADVNTVATLVDHLLQITPSLEAFCRVEDVLAEELSAEPDVVRLSRGDSVQSDFERCLTLIAILRQHCGDLLRNHFLVLRSAPESRVKVQARILTIEHERDDLNEVPTWPEVFRGDVLVCDDFRGLIQCLDASEVLVKSKDILGLETAIRIALYKSRLDRGENPDWNDFGDLRIGHQFFRTVEETRGASSALPGKILRAIVDTVDRENMARTHDIRTGPHGNDPQRMRGNDGAMRRDIDRDFHLHYWSCGNGIVELASVNYPHDNYWIPE